MRGRNRKGNLGFPEKILLYTLAIIFFGACYYLIRNIGFADALVSILSLQTAMFASFGGDNEFIRPMNAATGTVVCLMILIMGIRMIRMAAKEKKTEVYRL